MISDSGRRELEGYARATWHSLVQLTVPGTGLPADSIDGELRAATRARYTSPTNVAMLLWSVLVARDLGLIARDEAALRVARVLDSLDRLERHAASGQFYNWYDAETLETIRRWPEPPGARVYPFASSVDNGWLASALLMIPAAVPERPELGARARRLATSMSFACYYDAEAKAEGGPGLLRGGFWRTHEAPPGSEVLPHGDPACGGEAVVYTGHHYATFNSEPRITSYLAIALGQVPHEHYFAAWRTYPDSCPYAWQEARPVGHWRRYLGVDVFEGAYRVGGRRLVPSWGGSMFEALMPALVVPELRWGAHSWAVTHPLYVEAQIEFGLREARYDYWGFSPAADPAGGYREYGVDALGMNPDGYGSDVERLTVFDAGWDGPGCVRPHRPIADYGQGVVTPHAAFLALELAPAATLDNLAALRRDFPSLYGGGGFKDSVNIATGSCADRYLALDQGMVLAAIDAALGARLRGYLEPVLQPALEPLMRMERFAAAPAGSESPAAEAQKGPPEPLVI
jgi:hypothetical protein